MRSWWQRLVSEERDKEETHAGEAISLRQAIREAHREWKMAQTLFDQVDDPQLVDYAAHRVLAAQKRYTYLLKKQQDEELDAVLPSAEVRPGEEA